jgi:hypothetical protein
MVRHNAPPRPERPSPSSRPHPETPPRPIPRIRARSDLRPRRAGTPRQLPPSIRHHHLCQPGLAAASLQGPHRIPPLPSPQRLAVDGARLRQQLRCPSHEHLLPPRSLQRPHPRPSGRYQLIRNVLAAFATDSAFCVLCDARRRDLVETWYRVLSAVHYPSFAWRLKLLTWQELASVLPHDLQQFLDAKYGIQPA